MNKDQSFSTILCFENYINAKISQKDLLRDEKIFLWIKNDAFHVVSCQFLHFDEFYTLSYLYRVKLGSMSKFHKSCLSARLSGTLIFWENYGTKRNLPYILFDQGLLKCFFNDFFHGLHLIWRIFGNWILRTFGSGHFSLLREGNWANENYQ